MGLVHRNLSKEGASEKPPGGEPRDLGNAHIGVNSSSLIYKQCGQSMSGVSNVFICRIRITRVL